MPEATATAERGNHRRWWVIAALVLYYPFGLLLVWRFTQWRRSTKRILTAALIWPLGAWWLSRERFGHWTVRAAAWGLALCWIAANLVFPMWLLLWRT